MRLLPTSLLLTLAACGHKDDDSGPADAACDPAEANAAAPALVPGAPQAGVAEAMLLLPIGTPLSGYTGRCECFGGDGEADKRDSTYRYSFNPSAGVEAPIAVKAFWLTNGDQDLVVLKVDVIYSFDGLVEEMEDRLSAATGRNLDGKVVVATNHSHNAYGDFSDQVTYYLGSDRFNYEVFTRMAEQAEAVALDAWDTRQAAKLGMAFARDWDPADRVYHDRRNDNDELAFFSDLPPGRYKDPTLTVLRIDTLDDQPLGVLFDFGIHGTVLGGDNPMISPDAPGFVELLFQEQFDEPVVVALLQGGAGDASPSTSDGGFASLETTGVEARDALYEIWAATPTSAEPITLETASRSVSELHEDIRVTRGGTTDMHYVPYEEGLTPDNVVWNPDGTLIPEIDEFNLPFGAAFCGEDAPYLSGYAPADVEPYSICIPTDVMMGLIQGFFDLTEEEAAMPVPEMTKAGFTAASIGPLPIVEGDAAAIRAGKGSQTSDQVLIGFFPGEPTALYTEQFRRRAASELGFQHAMAVGYAQDHEGYLLVPEDWLQGGYEADINVWGPLQGEHIMEQLLLMAGEVLTTDVAEPHDPCGLYEPPSYGENVMPVAPPDITGDAGTLVTTPPAYLYSPLYTKAEQDAGTLVELTPEGAQVPRVQGLVQIAWKGGDPGVDWPIVTLEREVAADTWEPVAKGSGRLVQSGPDILVTTTPDPLAPAEDRQEHTWYAAWQAVGPVEDRAGVEPGRYRLHVAGVEFVGSETSYPWTTAPYEVIGPTFEVVPGALTAWIDGDTLYAAVPGPARGYRLIAMDGGYRGNNPLADDLVAIEVTHGDGSVTSSTVSGGHSGGVTSVTGMTELLGGDAQSVRVSDRYGNTTTVAVGS